MPLPSSELVAAAWIGSLPGYSPNMVATTLPKDPTSWASTGFVTVTPAGGSPAVDVPTRWSLIQVDTYRASVNSGKPPWGEASHLAEGIIKACWDDNQQTNVTVRAGYNVARLYSVWAVSDPIRMWDDPSSYARWRFDLRMTWTTLAAVA
jgi:hypothetical protein